MLSCLVVVCTKDRPTELERCLRALAPEGAPILVIDASTGGLPGQVCRDNGVEWLSATPPLALQRNLGIRVANERGADVLLFVDDDVVVRPGTVQRLVRALAEDPALGAVGPVVSNEPNVRAIAVKSFFRLWSRRPGALLPSGRNVLGHLPNVPGPRDVDWLSTCTIALRLSALADLRFDERLAGYSYGEDLDLTARLACVHRLRVIDEAVVWHEASARGRPDMQSLARRRTLLLHAWVKEHHELGLRARWFWWSVLGEVLIGVARFLAGDRVAGRELLGVLNGAVLAARGRSDRRAL
jgi:GT2 family glycosyltransferase